MCRCDGGHSHQREPAPQPLWLVENCPFADWQKLESLQSRISSEPLSTTDQAEIPEEMVKTDQVKNHRKRSLKESRVLNRRPTRPEIHTYLMESKIRRSNN